MLFLHFLQLFTLASAVLEFRLVPIQQNTDTTARAISQAESQAGGCPLLAIANILAFYGEIRFPDTETVTDSWITSKLQAKLDKKVNQIANDITLLPTKRNDKIMKILELDLSKLWQGEDVTIKFNEPDAFQTIPFNFEVFEIPLRHLWVCNRDSKYGKALKEYGYSYENVYAAVFPGNQTPREEFETLNEWMFKTEGLQMTKFGIESITQTLPMDKYAVLFQHNHFSVIGRFKGVTKGDEAFILPTFALKEQTTRFRTLKKYFEGLVKENDFEVIAG